MDLPAFFSALWGVVDGFGTLILAFHATTFISAVYGLFILGALSLLTVIFWPWFVQQSQYPPPPPGKFRRFVGWLLSPFISVYRRWKQHQRAKRTYPRQGLFGPEPEDWSLFLSERH